MNPSMTPTAPMHTYGPCSTIARPRRCPGPCAVCRPTAPGVAPARSPSGPRQPDVQSAGWCTGPRRRAGRPPAERRLAYDGGSGRGATCRRVERTWDAVVHRRRPTVQHRPDPPPAAGSLTGQGMSRWPIAAGPSASARGTDGPAPSTAAGAERGAFPASMPTAFDTVRPTGRPRALWRQGWAEAMTTLTLGVRPAGRATGWRSAGLGDGPIPVEDGADRHVQTGTRADRRTTNGSDPRHAGDRRPGAAHARGDRADGRHAAIGPMVGVAAGGRQYASRGGRRCRVAWLARMPVGGTGRPADRYE